MDMQDFQVSQLPSRTANAGTAAQSYNASGFSDALRRSTVQSPTSMDEMFELASRTHGVPVNLLKAVAKAESSFRADVVSGCGAIGVMQLMPGTARALGVTDPYDAQQNIMGGAKYLSDMLKKYDGDKTLALAAYNAGPGNVAKYGGVPPFPETQNYVAKVLGYTGQDLGNIGTAPTRIAASGIIADPTLQSASSLGELISSLLTSQESTTPQEAAKLYNVFHTLVEAQMNQSLMSKSDFFLDDGGPESETSDLLQQMRLFSL